MPASVSTPIGQRQMSPAVNGDQQAALQLSYKHNGLYLFVTRTVRPIWYARVISRVKIDGRMQWVRI